MKETTITSGGEDERVARLTAVLVEATCRSIIDELARGGVLPSQTVQANVRMIAVRAVASAIEPLAVVNLKARPTQEFADHIGLIDGIGGCKAGAEPHAYMHHLAHQLGKQLLRLGLIDVRRKPMPIIAAQSHADGVPHIEVEARVLCLPPLEVGPHEMGKPITRRSPIIGGNFSRG